MGSGSWIKWYHGMQFGPNVHGLAKKYDIDSRIAACCLMEFLSWFDGYAKSYVVELSEPVARRLEANMHWPHNFIDTLVELRILRHTGNEYELIDKTLCGSGQRKRKRRQVYFMLSPQTGLIKIGISHDPVSRARSLSTSERIELLGCFPADDSEEKRLHRKFKHLRQRGEWFSPDKELVDYIKGKGFAVDATR